MPVKHLQVPRYMSFLNNFDLNGEAGGYRGYFTQNKISQRKERMIFSYESYNEGQTAKN